jgi:hypothetical protein
MPPNTNEVRLAGACPIGHRDCRRAIDRGCPRLAHGGASDPDFSALLQPKEQTTIFGVGTSQAAWLLCGPHLCEGEMLCEN